MFVFQYFLDYISFNIYFIVNLLFLFFLFSVTLIYLAKIRIKRVIIINILFIVFSIFLGFVFSYKLNYNIDNKIIIMLEAMFWIIITYFFFTKKIKMSLKISKYDFIIFISYFLVAIFITSFLKIHNPLYLTPFDNFGVIGNAYFNADITRVVETSFTFNSPHPIHLLYRFINLPLNLIVILVDKFIIPLSINFKMNIALYNQFIYNGLTVILVYRILCRNIQITTQRIISYFAFIFSFSFIWLTLIPETYAPAIFFAVSTFYTFENNRHLSFLLLLFAVGLNPIFIYFFIPFIIMEFKRIQINANKSVLPKISFLILISILVLSSWKNYYYYILTFSKGLNFSISRVFDVFDYFIIPLLVGPNIDVVSPYIVQISNSRLYIVIIFIFLIGFVIFDLFKTKNIKSMLLFIFLIVGLVLHGILGFGLYNGILYSPLYSFIFIYLIITSFQNLKVNILIYSTISIFIVVNNIIWLNQFTHSIEKNNFIEFPGSETVLTEFFIDDINTNRFYIYESRLFDSQNRDILENRIDTYRYDSENHSITGILNDSRWFKIDLSKYPFEKNIQGKITYIYDHKDPAFFIFGMGLRNKYIIRESDNETFQLFDYNKNMIIFDNLTNIEIIPHEYKVKANQNDKSLIIFEDSNGIYYEHNNIITTLDDSYTINIPTLSTNNDINRVLRILLNEVMINITLNGPTPNFVAYEQTWYRDAAIIAMVLEITNNLNQIEGWIKSIDSMYDFNNGFNEFDNLGQVLYLQSLIENRNYNLIDDIINEIKLNSKLGYLNGKTDFELHPYYQTTWAKFGLRKLGINSDFLSLDLIDNDTYCELTWFYKFSDCKFRISDRRWPYLYYASLNYQNIKPYINFDYFDYPISEEYQATSANYEKLGIYSQHLSDIELSKPHAWSAAELFLLIYNTYN